MTEIASAALTLPTPYPVYPPGFVVVEAGGSVTLPFALYAFGLAFAALVGALWSPVLWRIALGVGRRPSDKPRSQSSPKFTKAREKRGKGNSFTNRPAPLTGCHRGPSGLAPAIPTSRWPRSVVPPPPRFSPATGGEKTAGGAPPWWETLEIKNSAPTPGDFMRRTAPPPIPSDDIGRFPPDD